MENEPKMSTPEKGEKIKKFLELTFTAGEETKIEIEIENGKVVISEDKLIEIFNYAGRRAEQDGAFDVAIKEPINIMENKIETSNNEVEKPEFVINMKVKNIKDGRIGKIVKISNGTWERTIEVKYDEYPKNSFYDEVLGRHFSNEKGHKELALNVIYQIRDREVEAIKNDTTLEK